MRTARMVSMSASRTRTSASSRRSAGQLAATASGASSPIATRAGRTPSSSMTSGVTRPPAATPSVRIASKPANMRARTRLVGQAGQQREAADVDQGVADADEAEQQDRRRLLGDGADDDQRRPEQRDRRRRTRAASRPRPTSPNARIDPSIPPAPTAAVRTPTPGSPVSQEVDRDHHDEDGQAAARERLHDAERRDQREPAIGRDGREPLQHLATAAPPRPASAEARRTRAATTTRPPSSDAAAHAANTAAGPLTASRTAAAAGPPSVADESSMPRTAFALVSCCGDVHSAGQQRRVRRPVQRLRDRGDDGEAVRRGDRAAGGRRPPRAAPSVAARTRPTHGQDPLAAHPVGHRREQRRQERRGGHARRR